MPILLPVLVRRSARSSTVRGDAPGASAPPFTARQNSAHVWTRSRSSSGAVFVERVAGEEEADRRRTRAAAAPPPATARARGCAARPRPRRRRRTCRPGRRRRSSCARWASAIIGVDGGVGAGAVGLELVEGAGRDEALQHALVDRARVRCAAAKSARSLNGSSPRASTIASTACAADALDARASA